MLTENLAYEFYLMAPPGVGVVVTSLGRRDGRGREEYERILENFGPAVARLAEADVDVILQAGLPPIAMKGWGFEDVLRKEIAKITAAPVATDIGSCIAAMKALKISKIAVVHPARFDDRTEDDIARYVNNAGIEVVAKSRISEVWHRESSHLPLEVPFRAGRRLMADATDADGLWFTGAFQPTVAIIEQLEEDIGRPVISSMQALTWAGMRLLGVRDTPPGLGSLFRER